ncbi:MAG: hypothetical protein V9E98_09575 [Candidatus Nanopelagicales bacterium]
MAHTSTEAQAPSVVWVLGDSALSGAASVGVASVGPGLSTGVVVAGVSRVVSGR